MVDDVRLIQRFVSRFERLDCLKLSHDAPPPPELSIGIDPDDWTVVRWRPAAITTSADALKVLRSRVGILPRLYEQLVLSYRWLRVDLGVCELLPNEPAHDLKPLANSLFADRAMNEVLIPAGYARFALAADSCDPICFDLNCLENGDCPVVRFNHEMILVHDRTGEPKTVFRSFRELIHAVLAIQLRR